MPHRRRRFRMGICCYVHRESVNSNITGVTGAADSVSPGICRKKECDKMIYFRQIKAGAADKKFAGCAVRENLQKAKRREENEELETISGSFDSRRDGDFPDSMSRKCRRNRFQKQ